MRVKVHYVGWKKTWDHWLEIPSDRIAPLGTHAHAATGRVASSESCSSARRAFLILSYQDYHMLLLLST